MMLRRALAIVLDRGRSSLAVQVVAGVLAVSLGFISALLLFFPAAPFKSWLEVEAASRYRLDLDIAAVHVTFPPALVAERVVLGKGGITYASFDEVRVAPYWSALLSGAPALTFAARSGDGRLDGSLTRDGLFAMTVEAFAVTVPLAKPAGASLAATVRSARLSGSWPNRPQVENLCQVNAEGVKLEGLGAFGVPTLPLGSVTLSGRGRSGELKFEKIEASGGALLVNGDGSLLLANPLGQSRPSLKLTLRRGPGLPPLVGDLLAAFAPAAADGTMRLHLAGSLVAPTFK